MITENQVKEAAKDKSNESLMLLLKSAEKKCKRNEILIMAWAVGAASSAFGLLINIIGFIETYKLYKLDYSEFFLLATLGCVLLAIEYRKKMKQCEIIIPELLSQIIKNNIT